MPKRNVNGQQTNSPIYDPSVAVPRVRKAAKIADENRRNGTRKTMAEREAAEAEALKNREQSQAPPAKRATEATRGTNGRGTAAQDSNTSQPAQVTASGNRSRSRKPVQASRSKSRAKEDEALEKPQPTRSVSRKTPQSRKTKQATRPKSGAKVNDSQPTRSANSKPKQSRKTAQGAKSTVGVDHWAADFQKAIEEKAKNEEKAAAERAREAQEEEPMDVEGQGTIEEQRDEPVEEQPKKKTRRNESASTSGAISRVEPVPRRIQPAREATSRDPTRKGKRAGQDSNHLQPAPAAERKNQAQKTTQATKSRRGQTAAVRFAQEQQEETTDAVPQESANEQDDGPVEKKPITRGDKKKENAAASRADLKITQAKKNEVTAEPKVLSGNTGTVNEPDSAASQFSGLFAETGQYVRLYHLRTINAQLEHRLNTPSGDCVKPLEEVKEDLEDDEVDGDEAEDGDDEENYGDGYDDLNLDQFGQETDAERALADGNLPDGIPAVQAQPIPQRSAIKEAQNIDYPIVHLSKKIVCDGDIFNIEINNVSDNKVNYSIYDRSSGRRDSTNGRLELSKKSGTLDKKESVKIEVNVDHFADPPKEDEIEVRLWNWDTPMNDGKKLFFAVQYAAHKPQTKKLDITDLDFDDEDFELLLPPTI